MLPRGAFVAVVLASTTFVASSFVTSTACADPAEPEPAACANAADRGQRARREGKLHDARDHFLSCSAPMCPESVQQDCLRWANDTIDLIPSIVIDATDDEGRDIGDARVIIDGYEVSTVTEGRSITVDPGWHSIRVERWGHVGIETKIIAKEGMHGRRVPALLARRHLDATPSTTPADERPPTTRPQWALAASGIGGATLTAGILILAASANTTQTDSLGTVRGLGWGSVAIGGAAMLTGLFAYFSEPAKPRTRAGITVTPVGAFGRF